MTTSPTAILRTDHDLILRALGLLERLADRLERGEPADEPIRTWLLDFFATFVDCHQRKGEQHLFPALEQRRLPRGSGPVGILLVEHDEGRRLLRALGEGDGRIRRDRLHRYAGWLRDHIRKENVLLAMADHILEESRQRQLVGAFRAVEEQAVGGDARDRLLADLARRGCSGTSTR